MNRDRIEGNWKQFRGKLKQSWGTLTNNPLIVADGARDKLAGRVQERHGISYDEAERQLEDFLDRNRNWHHLNR